MESRLLEGTISALDKKNAIIHIHNLPVSLLFVLCSLSSPLIHQMNILFVLFTLYISGWVENLELVFGSLLVYERSLLKYYVGKGKQPDVKCQIVSASNQKTL